jgi:DNA-binding transcriptional regulator LsrR (DeoR family)
MPRSRESFDSDTLVRIARWFYLEHKTQETISGYLSTNRARVSRMLEEARRRGIVQIEIREKQSTKLERKLLQRFPHLESVIIVRLRQGEKYDDLLTKWGVETARYFDRLVEAPGEHHIGIGGGETLLEFVESVSPRPRKNVHIHATALIGRGRLVGTASHVDPLVNATIL